MKRKYIYTQQMLARVFHFGTAYEDLFPKETVAGKLLAAIGSAITKLDSHAGGQVSGYGAVRTSRTSRSAARKALQLKLELTERTARALKVDKFYIPRNRSDAALIATGEAFALIGETMKEELVEQGLPATFVDDLNAAVTELKHALVDTKSTLGKRKAAITDFNDILHAALDDLRRFDALVINTLRDKPGIMTEWKTARRIDRVPVAKKQPEPETADTTATA